MKGHAYAGLTRRSILWKLLIVLGATILLTLWLSWSWNSAVELRTAYLRHSERHQLTDYAAQAQQVWRAEGPAGLQRWLQALRDKEHIWAVAADPHFHSLSTEPLSDADLKRMTFLRSVDGPLKRNRFNVVPDLLLPFPEEADHGALIMQLPSRFMLQSTGLVYRSVSALLPPLLACLLLGTLIYYTLLRPLRRLQFQANHLKGDNLSERLPDSITRRRDELGDLGQAFNHMTDRLQHTLEFQQQLLRDLSHELRTPLSRLAVARESQTELGELQTRVDREMQVMNQLVENTLKLAWLDTEAAAVELQPISLARLWDVIVEDACFESGWPASHLPCLLGDDCVVMGHLNGLHQALENLLRNAIRHSPEGGRVYFEGRLAAGQWHVWVRDEGAGVQAHELKRMFTPFVRLNGARPSDGGFGLGLSIARRALELQGVTLWASNHMPGLALNMRFQAALT